MITSDTIQFVDVEILTLKEAARRLRLSRVTLYRLARQGKLPGRKVGHSWRFHQADLDSWIRRRPLKGRLGRALRELKDRLVRLGGGGVRSVVLFGSYARGQAKEGSDLDLLVLVESRNPRIERRFHVASYQAMRRLDFSVVITLTVVTTEHFERLGRWGYSLYQNVTREGHPLWRAA